MTDKYEIRRITTLDLDDKVILEFIVKTYREMSERFGNKFDPLKFDIINYISTVRFMMCFRGGLPVGIMTYRLYASAFDDGKIICRCEHLSARPGSRAANLLMKEFIDFGKSNANHIITTIASETNIKRQSLEKLGFKELETSYRMETGK